QSPGAAIAPKQCRDERTGQGNATERITTLGGRSNRRNAVIHTIRNSRARTGSHRGSRSGSYKCVVRILDLPEYSDKTTRRRQCKYASETGPRDPTLANRITEKSIAKSLQTCGVASP